MGYERRRGGEGGRWINGMVSGTKPMGQEWPLSPLFLYLSRLRGKGKAGLLRGCREVRGGMT